MAVTLNIRESGTLLGYSFPTSNDVSADGAVVKNVSVPVAKTGTLTTRTDANTGTLTMAGGHDITTGDRLDLYWDGGSQRGITVGTVATNSVPFDLGVGDDLPIATTAITAMVPVEEDFVLTGDNCAALAVYSNQIGNIVFAESDDSEVKAYQVGGASGTAQSDFWTPGRDATNPLASASVTKVFFSHGSSTTAATMRAIALIS